MRTLPLVLLLGLAACDTVDSFPPEAGVGVEGVSLSADRESYDNDIEAVLALQNDGDDGVETGVLACAVLERRTSAGWDRALEVNDRACILPLVRVAAGETYAEAVRVEDVPDGTYRFVQDTSVGDVASPSFDVR